MPFPCVPFILLKCAFSVALLIVHLLIDGERMLEAELMLLALLPFCHWNENGMSGWSLYFVFMGKICALLLFFLIFIPYSLNLA